MSFSTAQLKEVLADIVEGKIVKRAKHELQWETRDVSLEFVDVLLERGYTPTTVAAVAVQPGERVPAFFIENGTAYFGWVFWEKFTQLRLRKLFGSVVRNEKGDWAIQISDKRTAVIYANVRLKSEMDIDNPSGF
ncbi:MAG: hypothetical protein C4326_01440 [Ignavibacteria bacterium]